jgi:transposase
MFVDDDIYTNTVESFWAIVKRAVYGIYFTFEEVFTAIY